MSDGLSTLNEAQLQQPLRTLRYRAAGTIVLSPLWRNRYPGCRAFVTVELVFRTSPRAYCQFSMGAERVGTWVNMVAATPRELVIYRGSQLPAHV